MAQRLTPFEAQKLVLKQGKGAFAIYEPHESPKDKIICCQTVEGKYQELRCIREGNSWSVRDEKFDSLADVLTNTANSKLMTKLVRKPEPFIKTSTRFDFWAPPKDADPDVIQKYPPDKLLHLYSKGVRISPYQFVSAAEQLRESMPKAGIEHPPLLTIMHKLYDKAAELLMEQGDALEAFRIRSLAAQNVIYPPSHPLREMEQAIDERAKLQKNPLFGAHFSGLDSGSVKGGNLRAWTRKLENNKTMNCFEFKVSKFARNDIYETTRIIQQNFQAFKDSLPDLLKGREVTIDNQAPYVFQGVDKDGIMGFKNEYTLPSAKALVVEFKGLGKVIIGNSTSYGCLSNDVRVEMESGLGEGIGLKALHQMLTVLGCGPVLGAQTKEDDERMKIAQIFRAFYPAKAIEMEQAKEFYEMPVDELKEKIERSVPGMQAVFKKYLQDSPDLMYKIDIYPGRSVWCIADLADQVKAKGAFGLMQGIGQSSFENGKETVVKLLKDGALSSQDRFLNGKFYQGVSSNLDLASGGGDQVFTRMITKSLTQEETTNFNFHGSIQVLWDISAINRVSYGFDDDNYGVKNPHDPNYFLYERRLTLMELASKIDSSHVDNEVMIKNRIGPEYIQGFVVANETEKKSLIEHLRMEGLIKNEGGQEMIHGYPVDQFIYAAKTFNPAMWKTMPAEKDFTVANHGKKTEEEAENLLQDQKIGTYLIYQNLNSSKYNLAFVDSENEAAFVYNKSQHELKTLLAQASNELKYPLKPSGT